jgi:hypothetical protein
VSPLLEPCAYSYAINALVSAGKVKRFLFLLIQGRNYLRDAANGPSALALLELLHFLQQTVAGHSGLLPLYLATGIAMCMPHTG